MKKIRHESFPVEKNLVVMHDYLKNFSRDFIRKKFSSNRFLEKHARVLLIGHRFTYVPFQGNLLKIGSF